MDTQLSVLENVAENVGWFGLVWMCSIGRLCAFPETPERLKMDSQPRPPVHPTFKLNDTPFVKRAIQSVFVCPKSHTIAIRVLGKLLLDPRTRSIMPSRRALKDFFLRATGQTAHTSGSVPDIPPSSTPCRTVENAVPIRSSPRTEPALNSVNTAQQPGFSKWPDIYSPLDANRREIRLCRILPFSLNAVSCVLSTVSLDTAPTFEALSYVWGDSSNRVPIRIDGRQLLVTRNLAAAMRALSSRAMMGFGSSPDYTRLIWIDAICIDQSNTSERNSQVRLMGDIYSEARHVVGWLGTEFENHMSFVSSKMGAYLETRDASILSATITFEDVEGKAHELMRIVVSLLTGVEVPDPAKKPYNYWHRVWTAQEIVKAKRVILQSGLAELPLDWLQEFHEYMTTTVRSDDFLGLSRVMADTILDTAPGTASAPLLDVLIRLGYRYCTDPRDKIYGLLGISDLAGSSHPGLKIDYGQDSTVRSVYVGAVRAIVDTTERLDVILQSRPAQRDPSHHLPSWTPSWTPRAEGAPPSAIIEPPPQSTWNAGGSVAKVTFSTRETQDGDFLDMLSTPGAVYGRVCAVSSRVHVPLDDLSPSVASIELVSKLTHELARAYGEMASRIAITTTTPGFKHKSKRSLPINIWESLNPLQPQHIAVNALRQDLVIYQASRTLTSATGAATGSDNHDLFPPNELYPGTGISALHMLSLDADASYIGYMLQISSLSLFAIEPVPTIRHPQRYAHKLWKTDPLLKRHKNLWHGDLVLGLCPSAVREGDVVVLLPGCQSPVVVREKEPEAEENKYYEVVGGVYIQGVNEGGMVKDIEKGKLPPLMFHLV